MVYEGIVMGNISLDRATLEQLGTQFELELKTYIKTKRPNGVIIHNAKLYSKQLDKDTQIDLIYISDKAVVIIEAKNWVDFIEGNIADIKWMGRSRAHVNMTVYNPVEQNSIHIRALRNALRLVGVNPPFFYNLVVLPDNTAIKSDCKEVINKSSLVGKLMEIERQSKYNINSKLLENKIREVCTI